MTTIQNSIGAQILVTIQATLKANIAAIADALQKAANTVIPITSNALNGVISLIQSFTQQQLNQIVAALNGALQLLDQVKLVLTLTATNLAPAIRDALNSEIDAVKAAVKKLVDPLAALAEAIKNSSIQGGVAVTGINELVTGLYAILAGILNGL